MLYHGGGGRAKCVTVCWRASRIGPVPPCTTPGIDSNFATRVCLHTSQTIRHFATSFINGHFKGILKLYDKDVLRTRDTEEVLGKEMQPLEILRRSGDNWDSDLPRMTLAWI
ncbi:unnamed protein product [Nezara viridula]|uniref:Uncharacterized protein n=1 Tax=Nezara viridula TaxID=85310 RepID=A0A9P0MT80_NEZVI|nr:unnamed protein product [Nezara viridula]